MSKITDGKVIALIIGIAKKVVARANIGISTVSYNPNTGSLVFTLADNSNVSVPITITASGIAYSNEDLQATNVADALSEIFNLIPEKISDLVDDSSFVTEKDLEDKDYATNTFVSDSVFYSIGAQFFLGADGAIENDEIIFEVQNDDAYDEKLLTNGREFEVDLLLPVVGDIELYYPMYIMFKGYKTPIYNILSGNDVATVADMLQLSKYRNETGYRWITKMRYILVGGNDPLRAFGITSTVTQQDIIRVDTEEMIDYLSDGGLPQGQVVLCDTVTVNNGYELGHFYRFKITYGDINTYEWEDITPSGHMPTTTASVLGNKDTYLIAAGGEYIFLGSVGALTITTTDPVIITINGSLHSVSFPDTTHTVTIKSTGYSGPIFNTTPNAVVDGSSLGAYHFNKIDVM